MNLFEVKAASRMDATKKSSSQLKREANQAKREYRKRSGDSLEPSLGGSSSKKRVKYSPGNSGYRNRPTKTDNIKTTSEVVHVPPKQQKKINKPKHLKRKLAQAEANMTEGAAAESAEVLALRREQEQLDKEKAEAKEKFFLLCKSLVGEDKWDDNKQATYDKLIKEKGCEKKKFLAALGVEEAKEKVKHRPDRSGDKRKKISRARKIAAQQKKQLQTDKNAGGASDSKL